jgi:polyferredoxin
MKTFFLKGRIVVQIIFAIVVLLGLFLGFYNKIHPFSNIFVLLALIAGNFFCGWVCAFGTIQELLGKIGSLFIKKKIKMPHVVQRYAQYTRYVLFVAVLILTITGIIQRNAKIPINAYRTFYDLFDSILASNFVITSSLIFLGFFLIVSMFFDRPFCNYFCTHSIKHALPGFTRIFTVKRNKTTCVNCKQCDRACPMNIQVSSAGELRNVQCLNCFQCMSRCPINGTLTYGKSSGLFRRKKADAIVEQQPRN